MQKLKNMQANYGEIEIKSLINKVRIFKKEIGLYQIFEITNNFDFIVKLTNGRILLKLKELQDNEKDEITPEQLMEIAKRFDSSTKKTNMQQQTTTKFQQSNTTPKIITQK